MAAPRGLRYHEESIPPRMAADLVEWLGSVDDEEWERVGGPGSRRVLQFGTVYRYKPTKGKEEILVKPFAPQLAPLLEILGEARPTQCIINEYLPGQGIAAHVDSPRQFGDTIWCFTVGGGCEIEFTRPSPAAVYYQYVHPGSLYVMSGDARYEWRHAIRGRLTDPIRENGKKSGKTTQRETRYSITFRTTK